MSAVETGASGGDAGFGTFDAMVAEELRDPYPEFARLREHSPVARQEPTTEGAPPAYAVYRHADVTRVLRGGATFSSAVIAQGMAEVWGRKIIVGMDAPEHHRHRALVSVAFRQTTLARWEDVLVRRVVDDLIDQFTDRGHANLVNEFTFAFPAKVIAGVLGLPEADYRQFQHWALDIINTALSGVEIPAGAIVTSMLGSANRDPDAYANPETFDIFRDPKQHMSFGTGPHLCLGMHLARMETRLALHALLDRLPSLRLDTDEATRVDAHIDGNLLLRSPTSLPVAWDRI